MISQTGLSSVSLTARKKKMNQLSQLIQETRVSFLSQLWQVS